MKKFFALFIVFICFTSNLAFAIDKKYDVTIFLLDISTSMNQMSEYKGKKMSRMNIAINSISQLAKNYEYSDKVGLRTIGATTDRVYEDVAANRDKYLNILMNSQNPILALYNHTCNNSEVPLPINYGSHAKIYDLMKTIKANGTSTPIAYTLKQAIDVDLAEYPAHMSKHIILITDGYEGCNADPCAYIKEISKTRKDIKIDVLSVLPDNADFSLYNCIAMSTGGSVYNPEINNQDGGWNTSIDFKPVNTAPITAKSIKSKNNALNNSIIYKSYLLQFE